MGLSNVFPAHIDCGIGSAQPMSDATCRKPDSNLRHILETTRANPPYSSSCKVMRQKGIKELPRPTIAGLQYSLFPATTLLALHANIWWPLTKMDARGSPQRPFVDRQGRKKSPWQGLWPVQILPRGAATGAARGLGRLFEHPGCLFWEHFSPHWRYPKMIPIPGMFWEHSASSSDWPRCSLARKITGSTRCRQFRSRAVP